MELSGIHHVSILVTDMERAVGFYSQVLGLEEIVRPSNFQTPVRWFTLGAQQIHLIPSDEPDSSSPRHFAIHVDDCAAARDYFTGKGVPPIETEPIAGADRFFIADPDGNHVEIIHFSREWSAESEKELGVPESTGLSLAERHQRELPV